MAEKQVRPHDHSLCEGSSKIRMWHHGPSEEQQRLIDELAARAKPYRVSPQMLEIARRIDAGESVSGDEILEAARHDR